MKAKLSCFLKYSIWGLINIININLFLTILPSIPYKYLYSIYIGNLLSLGILVCVMYIEDKLDS